MATGSAPIAQEVMDFMKICFSCNVIQGYGLTESGAGVCGTFPTDINCADHCGGSFANIKIRLRDVPEMGYLSTNNPPSGEICLKGQ